MPKSTKFGDDLGVRLGLVVAAHHAERHIRLAVFHDHRGHQRVQRPLVRTDLVGMARRQVEAGAAIVQRDAGFARDESRAEAAEQRLDERHDVALAVSRGHVNRVAEIAAVEIAIRRALPCGLPRPTKTAA